MSHDIYSAILIGKVQFGNWTSVNRSSANFALLVTDLTIPRSTLSLCTSVDAVGDLDPAFTVLGNTAQQGGIFLGRPLALRDPWIEGLTPPRESLNPGPGARQLLRNVAPRDILVKFFLKSFIRLYLLVVCQMPRLPFGDAADQDRIFFGIPTTLVDRCVKSALPSRRALHRRPTGNHL